MPINSTRMKNFHVPLPDDLYSRLRSEAKREKRPATELAREAIKDWIKQKEKRELHRAISEYAEKYAGTEFDLAEELEAASLESLSQGDME